MFYVFYSGGDCNDGSHTCGLVERATINEAHQEAEKWHKYFSVDGCDIQIIEGACVQADNAPPRQAGLAR